MVELHRGGPATNGATLSIQLNKVCSGCKEGLCREESIPATIPASLGYWWGKERSKRRAFVLQSRVILQRTESEYSSTSSENFTLHSQDLITQ